MTKFGTIVLVLGIAAAGCSSDDKTTPTASGVFPASGFAGRTVRVEISGDATNWTDGATVDFGAGITASNVTVASPTDIFADIAIDPTATAGLNDVTVTSGGTFTLTQAFEIDSAIDIGTTTLRQGSLATLTIQNHDIEHPFDATSSGTDPNTGATIYSNIALTGPAGLTFIVNSVADNQISVFTEVDLDAAASGTLTLASGPAAGTPITSEIPLTVAATTPVALSGTATGMIASPGDLTAYTITAAGSPSEIDFVTPPPSDAAALASVYVLGPSGHWSDFVTTNFESSFFGDFTLGSVGLLAPTGGTYYAIMMDAGTESGYSYTITGHTATFTDVAETGAGGDAGSTVGTAEAVAMLPGLVTPATLGTNDAGDWYKFTTGTQGMYVHAVTFGDDGTDTAIEIDDLATCDANNAISSDPNTGDPVVDDFNNEDTVAGPLSSTGFCVKVTQGSEFSSANNDYQLAVWLEAAE